MKANTDNKLFNKIINTNYIKDGLIIIILIAMTTIASCNAKSSNNVISDIPKEETEEVLKATEVEQTTTDTEEKMTQSTFSVSEQMKKAMQYPEILSSGLYHIVAIKNDETVVATGINISQQCDVASWNGIVSVSAGTNHTVGLKNDGSVVAVGANENHQCDVASWSQIVSVSAGWNNTVGLKYDGTVISTESNSSNNYNFVSWNNIVNISTALGHTVGLKKDGTVVAVGRNDEHQCDVSAWNNIVSISAGSVHTVGLKKDGKVVAVGENIKHQCDVSSWNNIVSISAGNAHTVGLKKDGTVVAVGRNDEHQCDVSAWNNIVSISAGMFNTVGLKKDGTVLDTGLNNTNKCDVSTWTDIRVSKTINDINIDNKENSKVDFKNKSINLKSNIDNSLTEGNLTSDDAYKLLAGKFQGYEISYYSEEDYVNETEHFYYFELCNYQSSAASLFVQASSGNLYTCYYNEEGEYFEPDTLVK